MKMNYRLTCNKLSRYFVQAYKILCTPLQFQAPWIHPRRVTSSCLDLPGDLLHSTLVELTFTRHTSQKNLYVLYLCIFLCYGVIQEEEFFSSNFSDDILPPNQPFENLYFCIISQNSKVLQINSIFAWFGFIE